MVVPGVPNQSYKRIGFGKKLSGRDKFYIIYIFLIFKHLERGRGLECENYFNLSTLFQEIQGNSSFLKG